MPSPAIASVWDIDLLEVTEQNGEACLKIAQPIMYAKLLLATVETALTFEETFSYTVVWQADLPALELSFEIKLLPPLNLQNGTSIMEGRTN